MAIEGPLKELGVHDVFQLLDLSRKTGVLRIASDLRQNDGTIYFESGAIVYAEIKSNPHPLGGLLVRGGKISEADLQRARSVQLQRGVGRLGEILIEIGALSRPELERRVRQQVEEVVFEVLAWQEGYFAFVEGEVGHVQSEAVIRIPVEAILMEGARRIDEWARIQRKIPNLAAVPQLAPADETNTGPIDLLPSEWETLAFVNGERSIRDIATRADRPEFEVAKTMFGLVSTGLVQIAAPRASQVSMMAGSDIDALLQAAEQQLERGAVNAARDALERAVLLVPADPRGHTALGRVHLLAGRAPAAAECLQRAIRIDPHAADAHRLLGFAFTTTGRLDEALNVWARWDALIIDRPDEAEHASDVTAARTAATTLLQQVQRVRLPADD